MASRPVAERFWEKVNKSSDCWFWTGSTTSTGYGCFRYQGRTRKAHRVAYMLTYGVELSSVELVCHACDTPLCVRPAHLFVGSQADNMRDCSSKRRMALQKNPNACYFALHPETRARGDKHGNHKLVAEQVRMVLGLNGAVPRKVIAGHLGVSVSNIDLIMQRKAWKHETALETAEALDRWQEITKDHRS